MRMLQLVKIPHETFNAEVEFHIVMSPEDLERAGLDELGKKWS